MRAMSLPERLTPHEAAGEGERCGGEIREGEDERSRKMTHCGKLDQEPAEQKPNGQTTDIAKKDLRHRPVEGREADHRTNEGGCEEGGQRFDRAGKAE